MRKILHKTGNKSEEKQKKIYKHDQTSDDKLKHIKNKSFYSIA